MSMGMTYDEFWEGDVQRTVAYRKADEIRRRQRNEYAWLQGRYIYDALCEASPLFRVSFSKGRISPSDYTKEPYPVTEAERREREERKRKEEMERLKMAFMQFASGIAKKLEQRTQSAEVRRSVESTEESENVGIYDRQSTNKDCSERERSISSDLELSKRGRKADREKIAERAEVPVDTVS